MRDSKISLGEAHQSKGEKSPVRNAMNAAMINGTNQSFQSDAFD